jgi:ABC-type polysaccharide/polyol phosphate export permease
MSSELAPAEAPRPAPEAAPRWRENRPESGFWPRLELRELWAFRELAATLAMRDIKLRYKQAFFGIAWALLQPVAAMVIFTIVFGRFTNLESDGIPYAVFVYAGVVLWSYHAAAVSGAAESLVEHRELVEKVYFPRLLAPMSAALASLLDLLVALPLLGVLMAIHDVGATGKIALLPLLILAAIVIAMGCGFWLSALNVLYRDVRYALGFVMQIWFFASPIVFPSSVLEGTVRTVFALNPVVGLIDASRWALLDAPPPPAADLLSLASGLLLFVTGVVFFRKVDRQFADRI